MVPFLMEEGLAVAVVGFADFSMIELDDGMSSGCMNN